MDRRTLLATSLTLGGTALAGCLGGVGGTDDGEDGNEDGDRADDGRDGLDEETVELGDQMAAAVEPDLSVREWRIVAEKYVLRYDADAAPEEAIPVLADAYADAVDEGFEYPAMPTALDDDDEIDYMVDVEPEWAAQYLEGEWTEDEYHAEIESSIH